MRRTEAAMRERLRTDLAAIRATSRTDRPGNLITTFPGAADAPAVMVFADMDQLGFFVRRIEADGLIRVERMGGVPERAMAAQAVTLYVGEGCDSAGIITNQAHHATMADEKYHVARARDHHRHRSRIEGGGRGGGDPHRHPGGVADAHDGTGRRADRRHLGR